MYPKSFREKVVLALSNGRSIRSVSSDFGISTNTVRRWKTNISPKIDNLAGRPTKIDRKALLKEVNLYPDAYQSDVNTNVFYTWIEQCLIYELPKKKHHYYEQRYFS